MKRSRPTAVVELEPGAAATSRTSGSSASRRRDSRRRRRSSGCSSSSPTTARPCATSASARSGSVFWRKPWTVSRVRGDGESAPRRSASGSCRPSRRRRAGRETRAPRQGETGGDAGEGGGAGRPPQPRSAARPKAALERDFGQWLEGVSLSRPARGPSWSARGWRARRADQREGVREPRFLLPGTAAGDVRPGVPRGGEGGGRSSATGGASWPARRKTASSCSPGRGRSLQALHLGGGRVWVNYAALVLCGTEIGISSSTTASRRGSPRRRASGPARWCSPCAAPPWCSPCRRSCRPWRAPKRWWPGRSTGVTRWRPCRSSKKAPREDGGAALPLRGPRHLVLQPVSAPERYCQR